MDKPVVRIRKQLLPGGLGWHKTAWTNVSMAALCSRTPFPPHILERLRMARVVLFGLGSGGSKLALNLAQAGVGRFRLVDPARVQVHNCIRHIASLRDVGRWKVDAVSDAMLLHNPTVEVELYPWDVFDPESPAKPETVLREADLAIAATDRTAVQLAINAWTWRLRVPAIFGGCYDGARGGEVLFTLPGEGTPCLACLRSGLEGPEPRGPFDYSAAQRAEDFQGEPGLNAAVDLITDVETQIALGVLLRDTDSPLGALIVPEYNFLLIGGALAAGYYRFKRPFHTFWQPLSGPRCDCHVCQPTRAHDDLPASVAQEVPPKFQALMEQWDQKSPRLPLEPAEDNLLGVHPSPS